MMVRADPSPLVGRERDLASVAALLRSADAHLVTLVGPPGIGKTRLTEEIASAVGAEFAEGVVYVDVGATPAPDLVLSAIARGLGVTGEAVRDTIAAAVRGRELLLIVDDVSSAAAPAVSAVLPLFERGRVLATSEEPLRIAGERVHQLQLVDDGRFGGLPLVGEVAGALPAGLQAREPRSIAEVLDLAYGALEPRQQRCFARLSVFAGGWTTESAEAVCYGPVADVLTALKSRRLVGSTPETGRFTMHPAIRAYAAEQLKRLGEAEAANRSLAEWVLARTEVGRLEGRAGAPTRAWRAGLEAEANNLRAALVWARASDPELLARIVTGAWWFYRNSSQSEGKLWLERALAAPMAEEPELRGDLLEGAAVITWEMGDARSADVLAQELLAIERLVNNPERLRKALVLSGNTAAGVRDYARAIPLYEEARDLARAADDAWALCYSTYNLGDTYFVQGDVARAKSLYEEALQLFTDAAQPLMVATTRGMLGYVAVSMGDLARAQRLFRDAVMASRRAATRTELVLGLEGLAWLAADRRELDRAARLLGAAERIREVAGVQVQDAEAPFRDCVITVVEAGGPALAAARAAGYALENAEAAAYALGD